MRNVTHYTATANQTTFTITGGYTVGLLDVFLNGVRIPESDFTATNGTTVVFNEGVKALDIITAVLYTASATSGITGAGTANYLAKWSGTSAIGNSVMQENSGSIGINGAAVPDSGDTRLQINGSQYSSLSLKSTSVNAIMRSHEPNGVLYIATISNHPIGFVTNDSEKMRLLANGNLGLGTTSPSGAAGVTLEINGASGQGRLAIKNNATGSSSLNGLQLGVDTGGGAFIEQRGANSLLLATNGTGRIFITAEGNIGIGTTTPRNNAGSIAMQLTGSLFPIFSINGSSSGIGGNFGIGSSTAYIGTYTNHGFSILTNDALRILITSNGNVQIGGTNFGSDAKVGISNNNNEAIEINPAISSNTGRILYYNRGTSTFISSLQIASDFQFQINGTERMRIGSNGNVSIGTTNTNDARLTITTTTSGASQALRVNADAGQNAISVSGSGLVRVDYPGIGGGRFEINDNGTMFLRMYGNGTMSISGGQVVTSSDKNLKIYDGTIDNALNKILKLIPKYFYWKTESGINPNERQLGFFAQDVNELLGDEVANKNQRDKWGINDRGILAMLVKSTQEIHYNFETQAEKIARLETRVQQLEAK